MLTLPGNLQSLRTLIVDDDEFMLEVVEETLRSFGIENIARASSGEQALRVIDESKEQFELLICDLNMDAMDGIETLRHLAERNCQAAIVVLSASDARIVHSVTNLAGEHRLRFLGSLKKPLEVAELHDLLLKFGQSDLEPPSKEPDRIASVAALSAEEIEEGLRSGAAQVAFQPIFSVRRRQVAGAECLLRWRNPRGETLPPEDVVHAAELHGLIVPLTEAVLRQAVQAFSEWNNYADGLSVSVNLSSRSLNSLNLPERLSNVVRAAGIDTQHVTLEITETGLLGDRASSLEVINRLALKGFRLSIDDFGIGQSNLEKLNSMPFTELKVDKSFVQGARDSSVARAIVESSVALAHNIELQVVAEGTETQQDLEFVIKAGCDMIQGHAIAKPMPAAAFMLWKDIWDKGRATGYSSFLHQ